MLKESMGGTEAAVAKREEACRIVPSPPKVAIKSTFWASKDCRLSPFSSLVVPCGIV